MTPPKEVSGFEPLGGDQTTRNRSFGSALAVDAEQAIELPTVNRGGDREGHLGPVDAQGALNPLPDLSSLGLLKDLGFQGVEAVEQGLRLADGEGGACWPW